MKTDLACALGIGVATEVCADTAIIGGIMAARGKAPWSFVAVAGGLAVAGIAVLLRMLPAIEDAVVDLAAEQLEGGCCCDGECGCGHDAEDVPAEGESPRAARIPLRGSYTTATL